MLGAIAGNSVGYEVGRHLGTRLLATRIFARQRQALERAQQTLRAEGGRAVFLARFTAFLRAVMPGLAGTARMPLPGRGQLPEGQEDRRRASAILLAVLVLAILVLLVRRRHRREQEDAPPDDAQPDDRTTPRI